MPRRTPLFIYSAGALYAAQVSGQRHWSAIKELEKMSGPNLDQAMYTVRIYATLNENEMAFSWLERGLAAGAIGIFYKDEPGRDPTSSDPRFASGSTSRATANNLRSRAARRRVT